MITAAWCRWLAGKRTADEADADAVTHEESIAAALTIAARVLDEGAVEGLARKIHAQVCGSDPDELIHHPAQKSWDDPNVPRWEQWRETAETILAYLKGEVE